MKTKIGKLKNSQFTFGLIRLRFADDVALEEAEDWQRREGWEGRPGTLTCPPLPLLPLLTLLPPLIWNVVEEWGTAEVTMDSVASIASEFDLTSSCGRLSKSRVLILNWSWSSVIFVATVRTLSSSSALTLLAEKVEAKVEIESDGEAFDALLHPVPTRDSVSPIPRSSFSLTNSSDCSKPSSSGEVEQWLGSPLAGEEYASGIGLWGKWIWCKYSSDKPSTEGAVQRKVVSSALNWLRLAISESA